MVGIQVTQDSASVCHRRIGTAFPVAHRTRCRTRAFRTDLKRTRRVYPDNGPTACTYFSQINGGHFQAVTGPGQQTRPGHDATADTVLNGTGILAIFYQRRFGGCTAHIECHNVTKSEFLTERMSTDDSGRWAGLDNMARQRTGLVYGRQPAI